MRTNHWLATLLVASMAVWTIGCGGGDEDKKDKDGGGGGGDGHAAHDGEGGGGGEQTAEEAAEAYIGAIKSKKLGKAWDQLPASYQSDINDVVHTFAEKMPEDAWNRGFGVLRKTVGVLESKKAFLMAHPMTAFIPGFNPEEFSQPYDDTVAVLKLVLESDAADLAKLRSTDVGKLADTVGGELMNKFQAISAKVPQDPFAASMKEIESAEYELVESTDTTAKLKLTKQQKKFEFDQDTGMLKESWETVTEEEEFVKVEGKWVPKKVADTFKDNIAEAKANLEKLTPEVVEEQSKQVMQVIDVFEPSIDAIAAAEDQNSFNDAVNSLIQQVQMFSGGGAGPGPGPGPGGPPPGE